MFVYLFLFVCLFVIVIFSNIPFFFIYRDNIDRQRYFLNVCFSIQTLELFKIVTLIVFNTK